MYCVLSVLLVVVVVVVVVVMDLAVSGNMLAAIGAVEELPVEQLDGDHSKYELLVELFQVSIETVVIVILTWNSM